MADIAIKKTKIEKQGGVVILSLEEYHKLCERAAPVYYLKGREAKRLDKLVEDGLKEHKAGKTIKASSLREALRMYAGKNKKN